MAFDIQELLRPAAPQGGALPGPRDAAFTQAFSDLLLGKDLIDPAAISRGRRAAEAASERFDLVLLDLMMPRLDGWETAVRLRKSPETAHIKVVLITARAQEDDKTRGGRVGADAYLTKPVDEDRLLETIAKYLPEATAGSGFYSPSMALIRT